MASIKLKETETVKYSQMEKEVFRLLQHYRDGQYTSTEWLTERVYKNLGRRPPQSSRIVLTGVLRSLTRKFKKNREPFKITRSPAAGPYSTEVRIELL